MNTSSPNNRSPQSEDDFDETFHRSLRLNGFLFPETEDELERFKACIATDPKPLPTELRDPFAILDRGRIVFTKSLYSADDDDIEENLAHAARDGGEIPAEVLKQMEEDRKNAEDVKNEQRGNTIERNK